MSSMQIAIMAISVIDHIPYTQPHNILKIRMEPQQLPPPHRPMKLSIAIIAVNGNRVSRRENGNCAV